MCCPERWCEATRLERFLNKARTSGFGVECEICTDAQEALVVPP